MQINSDKTVEFEVGDFVCDVVTGVERCGEVVEHDGLSVRVSGDASEEWWVEEKACYPG
ncbi:hypothetical protein [Pseudomonas sp. T1.Ur]|uniref:hypothetical protein n=1 Tax=Pseudomonas sp. T1.Ur TaxID=2928704 RepID=UPI00201D405C|nr:hypothetical protein [Pseudomonas sp. T1.Ur]MCL6701291.1 hypothetical protein [Pseudomonas sp. T1.Ur]